MRVVSSGIAVRSRHDQGRGSSAFPLVCVLPSGRWMIGYRQGADKILPPHRALLTWSDDQGATWTEPREPFPIVPKIAGRTGQFRSIGCTSLGGRRVLAVLYWLDVSDPSKPFFDEATETLTPSEVFWSLSEDDGSTWLPPRQIRPGEYDEMAKPITGQMLLLGDGRWACQFELNKPHGMAGPWVHKPVLCFSNDEGKTWPTCVVPAHDEKNRLFYWDQEPSTFGNEGRMFDLFWTFDRVASRYLNIHAAASEDYGRTWSTPWDTGVPGQPAPAQLARDGSIVMVYVDRSGEPTIKARRSRDGGRTFDAKTELVIHRRSDVGRQEIPDAKSKMGDAWDEMSAYSVGLPASALLPDGSLLVIWYTGPAATRTDIGWAVVDVS